MKRVKVWDLAVRLFHGALMVLVALAFFTSEEDETTWLHAWLGLGVLGLLLFRVAWGFTGSPYARFSAFVRGPRAVLAYARAYVRGRPPLHLSHNPLGAVMVLALLAILGGVTLTGLLVYLGPEFGGPLSPWIGRSAADALMETHEALTEALPWLIGLHVAGVLLSSLLERQNLVLGMITGRKRAPDDAVDEQAFRMSRARRFGALFASALLSGAAVVALAWLFPASRAEAAAPARPLLDEYDEEARGQDPSFRAFDKARGRALYFEAHAKGDKRTSCATCHTEDPTKEGRSPAGRVIDPLAPSASPERFTSRKHADKWFDRNCKQVLGRKCSAREKGDVLTWLLTL